MLKIKFERLDYQEKAVNSISGVFKNIRFVRNDDTKSNPAYELNSSKNTLIKNIEAIREKNKVSIGEVDIKDELVLDTLMETGTGKTFTFLESIYRLNRDYGLCKFIILAPSNPIRQGTIKNINITKEFFLKEYGKHISCYDYSEKTVQNFINASNQNISVLISTYQSFNKASNNINKNKIEKSLIGGAKSYMQALSHLRPVIIIDEPHRFEGKQTAKYLKEFNALFTLRFGATFKNDEYKNLLYTLDSIDAFSQGLVKAISVDTVGNENVDNHTIEFVSLSGANQKNYIAHIGYKDTKGKFKKIDLKKGDNLGQKVDIEYLNSYIVEKITKQEIIFSNGISLALGQSESYGILLNEMQRVIINTAIKNHFEREEELFKLGIKSLCLFFIDKVDKYLSDDGIDGELAKLFEKLYSKNLEEMLKKPLDEEYKKYLLKTKDNISAIHSGYFAKSKKQGDEAEAIDLILNKKEELLSFDSDLRFIFSQWALQEGWDNPNVMTLCKLAPSNSKISKLQQIGRGLRLAVNQDGKRITKESEYFDFVNELFVVVPSTEEHFVSSIQSEISEHSIKKVAQVFDEITMLDNNIIDTPRAAVRLLDTLEEFGFIKVQDDDSSLIVISKEEFHKKSHKLDEINIKGFNKQNLKEYFESYFSSLSRIKAKKRLSKKDDEIIKIHKQNFTRFKPLWENLNYDAVVRYNINSDELIKKTIDKINKNFDINGNDILIRRDEQVQNLKQESSIDVVILENHCIFNLYEFIKSLANTTKLSFKTISGVLSGIKKEKFELIAKNENLSLQKLNEQFISAIYETIINKISYDLKEIKTCNTSFTDEKGQIKEYICKGSLGKDKYTITNKTILKKSIYDENFMEVDSGIEEQTIEQSNDDKIIVFGKLPRVNIPTAHGKTYNPDFGYVVQNKDKKELYLIVETKGYDEFEDISVKEKLKIKSAEAYFEKLKQCGINVEYKTKLNSPELSQIINDILKN